MGQSSASSGNSGIYFEYYVLRLTIFFASGVGALVAMSLWQLMGVELMGFRVDGLVFVVIGALGGAGMTYYLHGLFTGFGWAKPWMDPTHLGFLAFFSLPMAIGYFFLLDWLFN